MNLPKLKQTLTFLAVGTLLSLFTINITVNGFSLGFLVTLTGVVFMSIACARLQKESRLFTAVLILSIALGVSTIAREFLAVDYSQYLPSDITSVVKIPNDVLTALPFTLIIEGVGSVVYVAGPCVLMFALRELSIKYCPSLYALTKKRSRGLVVWGSSYAFGSVAVLIVAIPFLQVINQYVAGTVNDVALLTKLSSYGMLSLVASTGIIGFFVMSILVTILVFKIKKFSMLPETPIEEPAKVVEETQEEDKYKIEENSSDNWDEETK